MSPTAAPTPPAPNRPRPPALRVARLCADHLSIYLPVILMAVLALGTYWLVRTTPVFAPAGPAQAVRHDPDYFMRDFAVKTFAPDGRLKSEVRGTEGRHYPDTDTLEIDQVHMRSYSAEGHVTVATAKRALSNSDSSEVQLFGNAVVVREPITQANGREIPRMEFRSEFLHAFTDTERVKSHLPVELIRGNDRFTGDAMDFDNLERVIELRGRVHGTLVPTPAAGAAPKPAR
ncbi:LPS export ABC transporter periplasmic protein LptC [Curvibacter sp. RS43]|uniref:LPS export ABC transporter periplasmic protein LptC n=1 Tax=Curvibacter microcysteis TaxID=3026419 RepID=UPI00235E8221|nr:LPS export ABC transporter periplasmic protein LptC [Curvibacter sp. RS43]MDD0810976.1 LPS export ABC transporter periplasmic protein LptC [Curvibacter sp. RS43]